MSAFDQTVEDGDLLGLRFDVLQKWPPQASKVPEMEILILFQVQAKKTHDRK